MEKLKNIEEFYTNLKGKVQKAFQDIDETKKILRQEIHHIGELKTQTTETKTFIGMDDVKELKDTIIGSVHGLITKCDEYRKRHINKNDLM